MFPITIPSTGKKTFFRPFTVKEEKILLVAQESKDFEQIILAVKQIVNNCVDGVDVEQFAMIDLEYTLLQLRSKSVGNEISFEIEDPDTEEKIKLTTNIDDIKISDRKKKSNKIKIDERYMAVMRYPVLNDVLKIRLDESVNKVDQLLNVMFSCIDSIVSNDGEEIFKLNEFTEEEVSEFLEDLSGKTIKDIRDFFESIPVLKIEIPYTNSLGKDKTFVLEGLESFFI